MLSAFIELSKNTQNIYSLGSALICHLSDQGAVLWTCDNFIYNSSVGRQSLQATLWFPCVSPCHLRVLHNNAALHVLFPQEPAENSFHLKHDLSSANGQLSKKKIYIFFKINLFDNYFVSCLFKNCFLIRLVKYPDEFLLVKCVNCGTIFKVIH